MSEVTFTDADFDEKVTKSKGLVVVDVYAPWCGPCKMMAPVIEKVSKQYEGKAVIGKLDTDENPATSEKFEIRSIPTLLFFKDGELVHKLAGFQSEEALTEAVDSFLG